MKVLKILSYQEDDIINFDCFLAITPSLYILFELFSHMQNQNNANALAFKVSPVPGINRIFFDLDHGMGNYGEYKRYEACLLMEYERMKQRKHEIAFKLRIWRMISEALTPYIPDAYLAIGGSTINGFGTQDSDLDLCENA